MAVKPNQTTTYSTPSTVQPDATAPVLIDAMLKEAATSFHLRAADILERAVDAFVAVDRNWRILYANREACRVKQKPLQELVGKIHWEEWPAAIGTDLERNLRHAMEARVKVHFEHHYVVGATHPYDIWLEYDVFPSEDGINIFYRDITGRKQAEQVLRRSQEDLHRAVDAAQIGTFYCDYPLDKIAWNDTCKEHFFLPSSADVDFSLFYSLLHPDDREFTRLAIERAQAERVEYDVEYRTQAPDGRTRWLNAIGRFHYDVGGEPIRFDGITLDISQRKTSDEALRRRAEREHFLAELVERSRRLSDPEEIIADAVCSVGAFLDVSRCVFADIDIEADTCTVLPDYRATEAVTSIAGVFPISDFGPFLITEYQAGRTVAVNDLRLDPAHFPARYLSAYEAIGVSAFVAAPVLRSSRLVSVIAVHCDVPRRWQPEEIALLQTVVEWTWLTGEVLRQQRALTREAETTLRILESITDAFFTLDYEYNFTYLNRETERVLFRTRDELLGRYIWEVFPEGAGSTFDQQYRLAMAEGVPVSFEEFYPPLDAWLEVRAYPSEGGLSVFFQNVNARKKLEQERERLAERERNIAAQLQDALQPAFPAQIPGLLVGKFTRAALDEAQIGGDFYDNFPLDNELYAIVIGDVSGKGLAAAQQLALIRNSLRTVLYLYHSPAEAATRLNAILSAHDLLVGFVTVWVGVYHTATGQVVYTSCGHEPGLIRRVGKSREDLRVEELKTTGPPLGVAQNAEYGELTFTLAPGDSLLLYTDGISEAGPNRRELLGTSGLTQILTGLPENTDVQGQAEMLVTEVSRYTSGVFRDDVAVLLAQRQ